jgi:hypothetical protein
MKKILLFVLLVLSPGGIVSQQAVGSAYAARPKLVVLLVIEQLRGDYLNRYSADYKTPSGFNLFLRRGAYFPECYFDYVNTVTASGHATIATGAYTDGHNIASDQWWDLDHTSTRPISSVEDLRYPLTGTTNEAARGASPQNELASTLGDEVVLATGGKAKLFGVSLKDSEAILLSGHASSGAYWIDRGTGRFITSTYWKSALPQWVEEFNHSGRAEKARKEAHASDGSFYDQIGAKPAAISYELDFVKALVVAENLGNHDVTDVLTISFPSTDFLGHQVGPDSPEQRKMLEAIDENLNSFFTWLAGRTDGGLDNVWIALTGDHGVAPSPSAAASLGMPAASLSSAMLVEDLNRDLNERLSPKKTVKYVLSGDLPYIDLDQRAFEAAGRTEAQAEEVVAAILPGVVRAEQINKSENSHTLQSATVRHVYTRVQIAAGAVPNTVEGRRILNSFSTNGGWWVLVIPGMYQMVGHESSGTTHDSPYSYDRHVPLAFYGSPFKTGTYLQRVEPVDLAVTFAALLGVNQPSSSVGRVLLEALHGTSASKGANESRIRNSPTPRP